MLHPQNEKGPWRFRPTTLLSDCTHKKTVKPLMKRATVCLFSVCCCWSYTRSAHLLCVKLRHHQFLKYIITAFLVRVSIENGF
jgi:hypothetical protein